MIFRPKNSSASAGSILVMGDGAGLCCGDADRNDYSTAELDTSGAPNTTVSNVNVTVPGGATSTVALDGAPLDWADPANDEAIMAALGKVATDLGFQWMDGGIELNRGATDTDLTVVIRDSVLVWNWIGTTSTAENAATATAVVP